MIFYVGQEVVCVDASLPANPWHRRNPLVLNQVYVVRAVLGKHDHFVDIDGSRRAWESKRFRPLVGKKTDISIFTKMLIPSGQKERV